MSVVIDSCIFCSAMDDSDVFHNDSSKLMTTLKTNDVYLPTIVVSETMVILVRKSHPDPKTLFDNLMSYRLVDINQKLLTKVYPDITTPSKLKTSDLLIALVAKTKRATLLTWDKQLLAYGSAYCPTMTPKTYLENIPLTC